MKRLVAISAMLAMLGLAGCDSIGGPKQTGGTLVGAGTGALIGSQIGSGDTRLAAVAIGTLLGGIAGSEVGKSLDRADRMEIASTTNNTLETYPTGGHAEWRNPDSGNYGTVTPTRTYQRADGTYCREFQQTVYVGGQMEEAFGTACRQSDGTWRIVS